MRRLKNTVLLTMLFSAMAFSTVSAQDFTDQEVKDYAIILMAQKSITEKISPLVNGYIAQQEGIDGKRYDALNKAAKGDVSKLPADATDLEKGFYGQMQKLVKARTKAAGTVVSNLAKYSLGAKQYNAIKKAYKSDSALKAKVDGIMAAM
ncbi:hypothetical protein [Roseivirga sp.]|uniref:hypothetical protein n=1 Tax=Roseivirga sp. TaxID=1964215 RepID=UPI003B8DB738